MGVKLKDIIYASKIKIGDLKGRIIAIDAPNTIYQFLSSIRQKDGTPLMDRKGRITSHLSGILYRTSAIIEKGIKVVYVFDGKSPHLKMETITKRRSVRVEAEKRWKKALREGKIEEARKYAVRSARISPDIISTSKKLLDLMGVPFVEAPAEGEAQASYIVQNGDAWAVASQDYDCLLFGAPRVVRNLAITGRAQELELLELERILKRLEITREQLVDMALLIGTDFNKGIKGIGPKSALKFIKEKGNIYNVLEELGEELDGDPEILREIFLNPDVTDDYKLSWRSPNREGIIDFLCHEHGFSEERVQNAIKKMQVEKSIQKSLTDWF
ncbi:MAG TPA: flap endonuclease-1 [Methanobacteriales archaeon]|nr:MAG: Flap endonuclease 1 [Methanobacteriaceae archaeon 41_258]MBC7089158.1 flap endonuclease-1 [Methanobacteriaceae archaeon]HIH62256.1 flap endonuclease-1 [Methanobacteriales archaeon]